MQFPLISRELIAIFKLVHGLFNFSVMLLFCYHARNGLMIRRARTGNTPLPFQAIKQHRRMGPLLALLGGGGFAAGLTLVMLDTGNVRSPSPNSTGGATQGQLRASDSTSRVAALG